MDTLLVARNLNNLTGLWQKMGARPVAPAGDIWQSPSWPYRCWLEPSAAASRVADAMAYIAQQQESLPAATLVPLWGINAQSDALFAEALHARGFAPALLQTGMSLALADSPSYVACGLNIQPVQHTEQAALWARTASIAFGYEVAAAVINQLLGDNNIELLLVHEPEGEAAIATALLFATGDTLGVHMVGVVPAWRGKGVALALMQAIIAKAQRQGYGYITLQASAAGEGIYRRLGFSAQFAMRSFKKRAE